MRIKEQIISFETAVLAKEKGLISQFGVGYNANGKGPTMFRGHPPVYACSQSLLQKWLREKHSQHIYITDWDGDWRWNHQWILGSCNGSSIGGFNTYELALEDGLLEALKLIK